MLQTHTYVKQVTNRPGLQLAIRTRRSLIQRDSKCAINMHVGLLLKTIHHQHAQAHTTHTHMNLRTLKTIQRTDILPPTSINHIKTALVRFDIVYRTVCPGQVPVVTAHAKKNINHM
jgi:hypothetical protein